MSIKDVRLRQYKKGEETVELWYKVIDPPLMLTGGPHPIIVGVGDQPGIALMREDLEKMLGGKEKLMPNWVVNPVATPGLLWERYAKDFGEQKMKDVYGDHWPPAYARPGEMVYAVRDQDAPQPLGSAPAAWISLTIDQFDPRVMHMSRGIWPEHMGRGLGRWTRGWAVKAAGSGAKYLQIAVSSKNQRHLTYVFADPFWSYIGRMYNSFTGSDTMSFLHRI